MSNESYIVLVKKNKKGDWILDTKWKKFVYFIGWLNTILLIIQGVLVLMAILLYLMGSI